MYLPLFGKKRITRRKNSTRSYPQVPDIAMNYHYPSIATDLDFGKRRVRRTTGSVCSGLRKNVCNQSATCKYVKRQGCRRKSIKTGYTMSGDEDLGSYADAAGIQFFGRRRYNVKGSPCNKLRRNVCKSSPNCSYTKRGCRRRKGTRGKVVYEGPSLSAFDKRRKRMSLIAFGKRRKRMSLSAFGKRRKRMSLIAFGKRRKRMSLSAFGKRRKSRKHYKLPKKIVKLCRKLKIKCTKKVGKHRVYKSLTDLKRMIKKRMKHVR